MVKRKKKIRPAFSLFFFFFFFSLFSGRCFASFFALFPFFFLSLYSLSRFVK